MSRKIALVMGSFHKELIQVMHDRAVATARDKGLHVIRKVWVPGSMEKPLAIKHLLSQEEIDGLAVLGIIERGETKHGRVMAEAVIKAIVQLQLEFYKPVGVGIIGPDVHPTQITPRLASYAEKAVDALATMFKLLE